MHLKSLIKFGLALAIIFSSIFAYADEDLDGYKMHVKIDNQTGSYCTLKNTSVVYGVFINSTLPESILNNHSISFEMDQTWYGPDVILTYECGTNRIQFEIQQTTSVVEGHEPSVNIIDAATTHLKLITKDVVPSSLFKDTKSRITILLQKIN